MSGRWRTREPCRSVSAGPRRKSASSSCGAAPGAGGPFVYERVAEDIVARIVSGELPPGTRLRAERELVAYYGVAYGTIRRAMEVLRKRKLIITIHGRGTFVAGAPALVCVF